MAFARLASFRKSIKEKREQQEQEKKRLKCQQEVKHIILEILDTEESYIKNLEIVIDGYMQHFREPNPIVSIPDDLKIRARLIFNNIEEIYSFHKDYFFMLLKDNSDCPNKLAKQFVRCESEFHMYSKYCSKREFSVIIVRRYSDYFENLSRELGQKHTIEFFLMQPPQQMFRYKLLLDRLVENVHAIERESPMLDEASKVIKRIVAEANFFKCVDGIFKYPGDITEQGKLIHHDFLNCKNKKKWVRYYVFMFKYILLFTIKSRSENRYLYQRQIPMNKFKIEKGDPFKIISTETHSDLIIVCRGDNQESNHNWLEKIQNELKLQEEFAAELQNPTDDISI
ncbi:rho guanine nucleotide exchange factor 25-like [Musca autumnalis]|uniref:rho guanine nucleotide exchange factor 25-like n=1 Tax=Musca autumnalis TaxID=221902 RepID=UPI003CF97FFF